MFLHAFSGWSPPEYRDCHLVLPLNLLETFKHSDYAVKVLEEFGRVSYQGITVRGNQDQAKT